MNRKNLALLSLGVILSLGFMGCSSKKLKMDIESDHNPLTDFSSFKTYDFAPGQKINVEHKKVNAEFLDTKIRQSVAQQLDKKKFEKSSGAYPDFWVAYKAAFTKEGKTRKVMQWDMADLGGSEKFLGERDYHIDKGAIVLMVVDPKTSKPIWWGTASAKLDFDQKLTWEDREKRINSAVLAILKKFPPQ